ncbi:uncharacterized protein LOC127748612, partial [Frankliniella occidentalis]|uniref:Uncharacterized protein LOC127748612 n=1 Tax=Frankliniella occidentalis TaxID=133901 RepID=A0A9C6XA22_FRAOC
AFQGPPGKFPNNFALLQLLGDVKCGAAASPKCWAEHDVLAVGAALKRRLEEGVLSRAAGQLRGLQDQVQEEQAAQALTLLGGQSWGLTLRGGDRVFSGTLADAEDPVTQAVLLGVVAKAGLTEATSSEGKYEVHWDTDRTNSAKAKDQADNVELVRGVERLINVDCSHHALLEVLQAAASTVEHLSVSMATAAALRETCAMPRLKRLQVIRCSLDFADKDDDDAAPGPGAVPLPPLPGGQARLQWLQVLAPRRALLELLLPAHRLTLEVLQLDSCSDNYSKMTC